MYLIVPPLNTFHQAEWLGPLVMFEGSSEMLESFVPLGVNSSKGRPLVGFDGFEIANR